VRFDFIQALILRGFQIYTKLSKNETKVLATIIAVKSGNAYKTWKTSGLKHYPTVLRTIKKLEEKRLVKTLSKNGIRGERIYAPTLFGTLLNYALRDDKDKLREIISLESPRFQEALESGVIDDSWLYSIVLDMASDAMGGKKHTIDDMMEETLSEIISNELLTIVHYPEHKNRIIKFAKVQWIRELTIKYIEDETEWAEKYVQELKKLKGELTV